MATKPEVTVWHGIHPNQSTNCTISIFALQYIVTKIAADTCILYSIIKVQRGCQARGFFTKVQFTLVNVYVDLVVFTRIAGTS